MLDEKDLQAIAQLLAQQKSEIMQEIDARFAEQEQRIDARFAEQEQRIDARFAEQEQKIDVRFGEQKKEIMHEVGLLMESYFDPKFNALADGLEILKEKALGREELEETADRLDVLEAVVKVHSRKIEKLEKMQSA